MVRHPATVVLGAWVALVLWGCSSQPSDPPGVDAGVSLSPVELCDRMATARCGLLSRCHAAWSREPADGCQQLEQSRCLAEYGRLRPSFEAGAVEIDSEKVLACEERMRSSTCTASFPPGFGAGIATAYADCQLGTGLLRGKLASGSTCSDAVECAPGTVCVKPGGVCRGTCSSIPREGEPCAFGCASGLYCDAAGTGDPVDDRCARPKPLNAPCESSVECEADLWCDSMCKPRGSLGDPCRWDPERISTCAPGLACDVVPFVAGQVGACVVPQPEGGACRFHWSCAPGLVCYALDWSQFPASPPRAGVCTAPALPNMACTYTPYAAFVGDPCAAGTSCDAQNRCVALPVRGEACNPLTQSCSGLDVYCKPSQTAPDQGTCTGPAGLNERCASRLGSGQVVQIPCETGYCDAETTLNCLPASRGIGELCGSDGECLSGRCAVQEDQSLRCAPSCL